MNKVNLKLRKLEPSDLPFLYQWENDATMWADSDTHNPLSRHDLHQYIENTTGDIYRDGHKYKLVVFLVGLFGLKFGLKFAFGWFGEVPTNRRNSRNPQHRLVCSH